LFDSVDLAAAPNSLWGIVLHVGLDTDVVEFQTQLIGISARVPVVTMAGH
jgi:hypothetical protein